jgi:hypothetical protein
LTDRIDVSASTTGDRARTAAGTSRSPGGWSFDLGGAISAQATDAESGWPNCNRSDFDRIPPVGEWNADPTRTVDVRKLASAVETSSPENHREELRTLVRLGASHQPQTRAGAARQHRGTRG